MCLYDSIASLPVPSELFERLTLRDVRMLPGRAVRVASISNHMYPASVGKLGPHICQPEPIWPDFIDKDTSVIILQQSISELIIKIDKICRIIAGHLDPSVFYFTTRILVQITKLEDTRRFIITPSDRWVGSENGLDQRRTTARSPCYKYVLPMGC